MIKEDGRNKDTLRESKDVEILSLSPSNANRSENTTLNIDKSYIEINASSIKQEDNTSMYDTALPRTNIAPYNTLQERYSKGAGNVHPRTATSPTNNNTTNTTSSSTRTNRKNKKGIVVYDSSDLSKPFPEDYQLYCYKYGTFLNAVILETCKREDIPSLKPETEQIYSQQLGMIPYDYSKHEYAYYVHYVRWDRRMDEWVGRDRLRLQEELVYLINLQDENTQNENTSLLHPTSTSNTTTNVNNSISTSKPTKTISSTDDGNLRCTISNNIKALNIRVETREEALQISKKPHYNNHFTEEEQHEHNSVTKVKNIDEIVMGKYIMPTWYHSPFPEEYCKTRKLYFCEYCLSFFIHQNELLHHEKSCTLRHPPGDEIYRSKETNVEIAMFEVDGQKERVYCENLCCIAKLFLDHKTLHEDTSIFLFYILCELTPRGYIVVGYFSKEKLWVLNNLACILTLPCHQRKGYGKFLISMSYELSKLEGRIGGPERPLSDLGRVSYLNYWLSQVVKVLEQLLLSCNDPNLWLYKDTSDIETEISDNTTLNTPNSSGNYIIPLQSQQNKKQSNNYSHIFSYTSTNMYQLSHEPEISLEELSRLTYIHVADVQDALKENHILMWDKGRWVLSLTQLRIYLEKKRKSNERIKQKELKLKSKGLPMPKRISVNEVIPHKIHWTSYIASTSKKKRFEDTFVNTVGTDEFALQKTTERPRRNRYEWKR